MKKEVKPLYRKMNTRARNVHHNFGSDARHDRNTKSGLKKSMGGVKQRGLDYTPLYKFLLSKVGEDWNKVYSEAVGRLDNDDAIYHLVLTDELRAIVKVGESTYYSGLYVDSNNKLQRVNTSITNEMLWPSCHCCTHTLNGKPFVNKYNPLARNKEV